MRKNKNNNSMVAKDSIIELEKQINLLTYYLIGEDDCRELRSDTHKFSTIKNIDATSFPSREDALVHDLTERVLRLRKMVQAKS